MFVIRLVVLLGILYAFVGAHSYESTREGYDSWAARFNKAKHPSHRQYAVWLENNQFVNSVNGKKGGSWTADLNKFGDLTAEEFKSQVLMRQSLDVKSIDGVVSRKRIPVEKNSGGCSVPGCTDPRHNHGGANVTSFDWRNIGGVTPVQDQGFVGTCWTFSTVANIEGQHFIKTNETIKLSEEFFVDCDGTSDYDLKHADCSIFGGWPYLAYQFAIQKQGIPSEESYPYCAGTGKCMPCMKGPEDLCGPPPYSCDRTIFESKCMDGEYDKSAVISDWGSLSTDETELASQLMTVGPLSALLDAQGLQFYKSGVWTGSMSDKPLLGCSKTYLDHAITITGFGTDSDSGMDYWSVKNSWAEDWGEEGYFRIQKGVGMCGINTAVTTSKI